MAVTAPVSWTWQFVLFVTTWRPSDVIAECKSDLHGRMNQNSVSSTFKLFSGATGHVSTLVWLHTSQRQRAISIPERHIVSTW